MVQWVATVPIKFVVFTALIFCFTHYDLSYSIKASKKGWHLLGKIDQLACVM